jgi:hypothetical protein
VILFIAAIYGMVHGQITLITLLFMGVAILDYLFNQTGPLKEKE